MTSPPASRPPPAQADRAGDLLVLAGEAPTPRLAADALVAAGRALMAQGQLVFAREQFDAALALAPGCVRVEPSFAPTFVPPFVPQQVLLFSGHMVDAPARAAPRFPAAKVPAAQAAIEGALDALGAGAGDLALTQGAAGGDLLFTEACQARGVRVQWLQPLAEPDFIATSVLRSEGGAQWHARYRAAKARLHPEHPPRSMPDELGPPPPGVGAWERGNLWLLYTALAYGPDKVRLVCLWDGRGGDGPGGTRHMHDEVKRRSGHVIWLDTRTL